MHQVLIIHGPNLNLLGSREVKLYGRQTLAELNQDLLKQAHGLGLNLEILQSNAEHEIVEAIQKALSKMDFIIINPAALTHTSLALRDALLAVNIPFIEVHLSNIQAREPFRKHSYLSDIAHGVIFGMGALAYELALLAAHKQLAKN